MPLILKEKGVTAQTVGFLWTILPFFTLFTNSLSGSIADAFNIYKSVFLLSLILLTIGSCSVYFLPSFKPQTEFNLTDLFSKQYNATFPPFNGSNYVLRNESELSHFPNDNGLAMAKKRMLANFPRIEEATFENSTNFQMKTNFLIENFESFLHTLKTTHFWLIFLCLAVHFVGINMAVIFSDAVCLKILGENLLYF